MHGIIHTLLLFSKRYDHANQAPLSDLQKVLITCSMLFRLQRLLRQCQVKIGSTCSMH